MNQLKKKFSVEKELLLALMGIETNFGKYLGKMDIISSLSTLSFDKRRSAFFTNELLILLKLIDKNIIDKNTLYGSWAGAFGTFQFMPSTIKSYAIDYNKNFDKINLISSNFNVDKNLLLSLMGIETNFGNYLGKMDIISSLATLSYDKRRSDFFTSELIILLKLIDNKILDPKSLYGSWAGAFGNFQFMPSTIKNYAIDFDKNGYIELKNTDDSFASAANYLNKLGWSNNKPCFYTVELKESIPEDYLNISAKKIHSIKKVKYLKKYIKVSKNLDNYNHLNAAIITPDFEIVENPNKLSPAYIVFDNYRLILKWNRSLRFALAICTLKEKFSNEL